MIDVVLKNYVVIFYVSHNIRLKLGYLRFAWQERPLPYCKGIDTDFQVELKAVTLLKVFYQQQRNGDAFDKCYRSDGGFRAYEGWIPEILNSSGSNKCIKL